MEGKRSRIEDHPILDFKRGKELTFTFNGEDIKGYENESVAAALFASGVRVFRRSLRFDHPRGWFCGIGKCSSCLMRVNEVPNVRTCITPVRDGMIVERQEGSGKLPNKSETEKTREQKDVETLIVGGGPAGLAAGITAEKLGSETLIIDENFHPGGQLIKQTHKFFGSREQYASVRGISIADKLLEDLSNYGGTYLTRTSVVGYYGKGKKHTLLGVQRTDNGYKELEFSAENIVVASGAQENYLDFPGNYLPGVYGAGGVQTLMNVYGVRPGQNALIIGAGNVGLIVAYQLMQAGVNVKAIAEALPHIGGYLVHASKVSRLGVPILLRHSIKKAKGKRQVTGATIVELDENWQEIEGTEKDLDVDLICIAVGLSPSTELLLQAGCKRMFVGELGGWIPIHDRSMETSLSGMYLAGDVSGIEEASTAMMEGKIAGATIAGKRGHKPKNAEKIKREAQDHLKKARKSPFLKPVAKGKKKVWKRWNEVS